jgi:hypothetical protein
MKLGNINKFGGDLSKVVSKLGDTVQVCVCVCVCVCDQVFFHALPAPAVLEHRPLTCPAVPAQERTRTLQSHLEETFEVRGEKVSSPCIHDP